MAEDEFTRAGTVILRDLELFNQATVFFEEHVDPAIRSTVSDLVKGWMQTATWQGHADASEWLSEIQLWPAAWREGEDQPFARFNFDYQDGDATESFQVADLFGVGQTKFGFRFLPEHSWYGGKSAWNVFAKTLAPQIEPLAKAGWLHEGKGVLFRPVALSTDYLVSAWENKDWSHALAPLTAALEALERDQSLFDAIIYRAKPRGT